MYFLIGADTVPTEANERSFAEGDVKSVVGDEIWDLLQNAEYRIVNIEAPVTDAVAPIAKCGPNLRIPSNCAKGFAAMHIDLAALANNHIMDQGAVGLAETCRALKEAGINYMGVGQDSASARLPHIFSFNGKKVGVLNCVEHEFSVAESDLPGANPFDPLETPDDVAGLKAQCDFVIVLYHGGGEQYRYPSPQLRVICRKLADKGADLVVCQHSHCIGCEELYNGSRIIYGQGNFLFALRDNDYWNSGLLIRVNEDLSVTYIPAVRDGIGVRMARGAEADEIMAGFHRRSAEIKNDDFVQNAYDEYARKRLPFYLGACYPAKGFFARVLNKLLGGGYQSRVLNKVFGRPELMRLYNYIYCEAHRELFVRGLKDRAEDHRDRRK
ncbi:MAG: CapA family protein [Abditibacteriota bacterium]|nr:CapA family protein [Abditibacteriota bacterium]